MKSSWYNTTGVSILAASFILVLSTMVQEQQNQYLLFAQEQSSSNTPNSSSSSSCDNADDCCANPDFGGYDGCSCCDPSEPGCTSCGASSKSSRGSSRSSTSSATSNNPPPNGSSTPGGGPGGGPGGPPPNSSTNSSSNSSSSGPTDGCTHVRGTDSKTADKVNIVFRFVGHDPDTGIIDQMIDSLFSRAPFTGNEDAFQIWHHNERTEVSGTPDLSKNCFTICDHDGTCDLPNEVDVSVCYAACRAYAMLGSYNGKGMGTESTVSTEDRTSYVFVHEFAHQFGGLRDEYGEAGKDNYSGKPNCADTQEQAKQWWQDLFGISQGEPGCSYDDENYKPVKDTIMEGDGDNEFGVVNEYYLLRKICLFEGACGNTGSSSSVTSTGSSVSSAASLPISSAQNSGQNSIVTSVASSSLSVPSSVSSSLSGATVLSDSSASVTASQESSFPDEFPQYPVLCVDLERADNDEFVIVNYLAEMRFAPVGRTYADGRLLRITIGNREYSTLFRDQQLLISESFGDPSAEQLTQIIPLDEVSVCLDLDPEHVIISDGHIVLLNPPPNPNGQQQQQGEIQPEATTDECSGEPLCPEEGNCTCQIQLNHGGTYGCPLYQQ